jgi:hypothetical protein
MKRLPLVAAAAMLAACLNVGATEVAYFTEPVHVGAQRVSVAADPKAYRVDAARHIYAAYAPRIYKGRLPPLIHGVVVVETTVDSAGYPRQIQLVRGPSHAPDVSAAVIEMIKRAGPLPVPSRFGASGVRFTEIWLVHKDGRFQLDSLTEGQN